MSDSNSRRGGVALASHLSFFAALLSLVTGCEPDLGATASSVERLRFLAIQSEPAEAAPGTAINYKTLVVDSTGEQDDVPIDWAYCNLQKPLSDQDDMNALCFTGEADYLTSLGVGPTASGTLPSTGCALFGPDVPPVVADEPPGRPTDPDPTGGYYQPVRLMDVQDQQFALAGGVTRILCGLPGATAQALTTFRQEYIANTNPWIDSIGIVSGDEVTNIPLDDSADPPTIARGSKVTLRLAWPFCPWVATCGDQYCTPSEDATNCPEDCSPAIPCGGAEPFPYYDAADQSITLVRETMTVSWFAIAGTFEQDRSIRNADDANQTSDNTWTAPNEAGVVTMWAVLRDNRAGVTWKRFKLNVQ